MGRNKGSKNGVIGNKISQKQFEGLCELLCTAEEICGVFGVSFPTLNAWCKNNYDDMTFEEVWKIKSANGKVSLRRAQFRLAESNAAMAIFLGKNYLDQNDESGMPNNNVQLISVQVIDAEQYKSKIEQIENQIIKPLAIKEPNN